MLRRFKNIESRRRFFEKKIKQPLSVFSFYPPGLSEAEKRNCENMIGAVQVPLGVAGPLRIKRAKSFHDYYLPLATTEGALVASVARGCKIITACGGASVLTENKGITRGSVFITGGILESRKLSDWLERHLEEFKSVASETSAHLELSQIFKRYFGNRLFIRFTFDSQDAMGMNMATIASEKIAAVIEAKTGFKCLAIAANFDTDKKPSYLNFILGRGRAVWAEIELEEKLVRQILKTTPALIHEVNIEKNLHGSMLSGSLGFNAHFANILAAIFLATGQDIAHVSEGSLGITSTKIINKNLTVSVYLPDLPVGTVGGGTYLPSQRAALQIMGVDGGEKGKKAAELAEIIGGAVLAGEISLLAAIASGTLGSSHQRLARSGR